LSKNADFNLPHLYLSPPFDVTPFEFADIFATGHELQTFQAVIERCHVEIVDEHGAL